MPSPTTDDLRIAVDRALARLGTAIDAPRDLAVALALAEGITAEQALERCGVDVSGLPHGRAARVAFVRVPPDGLFRTDGVRYRKLSAKRARRLAPGAPNALAVLDDEPRFFLPTERVEIVPTSRRRAA